MQTTVEYLLNQMILFVSLSAETFKTMDTDADGVISLNFFQVGHSQMLPKQHIFIQMYMYL